MLTISKPLSASQARTYHAREFAAQEQNYWSRDQKGHSEWQGRLAEQWNLTGAVESRYFARLSEGQHPHSEEQLVRHQVSRSYLGKFGKEVTSAEHRAGWDATFSAPKSVSLTALVGSDDRVREAHRESVRLALQELERYTQARIGNVHAPETTGKFVAATFEHDTARPVDGYAAPQLHTHAVIFNMTERENGPENGKQTRALQPHEMFVSQRYATAVYRSELALLSKSWVTAWSAASMDSRKSAATRRNIWTLPVHGENRSKTISESRESTEPRQPRSPPTIRATARNYCQQEKSYSGTASWPPCMDIRQTA
jgi:conjugative relaxase-like TrwC/TraI family protein